MGYIVSAVEFRVGQRNGGDGSGGDVYAQNRIGVAGQAVNDGTATDTPQPFEFTSKLGSYVIHPIVFALG